MKVSVVSMPLWPFEALARVAMAEAKHCTRVGSHQMIFNVSPMAGLQRLAVTLTFEHRYYGTSLSADPPALSHGLLEGAFKSRFSS